MRCVYNNNQQRSRRRTTTGPGQARAKRQGPELLKKQSTRCANAWDAMQKDEVGVGVPGLGLPVRSRTNRHHSSSSGGSITSGGLFQNKNIGTKRQAELGCWLAGCNNKKEEEQNTMIFKKMGLVAWCVNERLGRERRNKNRSVGPLQRTSGDARENDWM